MHPFHDEGNDVFIYIKKQNNDCAHCFFFYSFFFKMKNYTRYECTRKLLNIDEYVLQKIEKSISERYN